MAITEIVNQLKLAAKETETFLNTHFAKIALTVSTLVLAFFASAELVLGSAVGFALHYYMAPTGNQNDKIVTAPNTLFAIIGAMSALIRFTPAGKAGGLIFKAIPLVCSLAVGSTGYRAAYNTPQIRQVLLH